MARPARGSLEVVNRKDGLRTFYLRLTVDGRRQRVRLGSDGDGWTMGRAVVALEQHLEAVRAGTWKRPEAPAERSDDPTFRAFASGWFEDNRLEWRPSTIKDIRWRLASHLLPLVGEDRLSTYAGPLLPTRSGTRYDRSGAAGSIIKPLVKQTNVVLAERHLPVLREGVTAHALRKTYFSFLHEAGAPPRWVADQGGHADPSTSLRIYAESLRDRERSRYGRAFDELLNGDRGQRADP